MWTVQPHRDPVQRHLKRPNADGHGRSIPIASRARSRSPRQRHGRAAAASLERVRHLLPEDVTPAVHVRDWRIEEGPSIACGSGSDEDLWIPAFVRLVGREVEDLATFGSLPEVVLSLAGDMRVASFMTAEGDPGWALFDRRGHHIITACCQAGVVGIE